MEEHLNDALEDFWVDPFCLQLLSESIGHFQGRMLLRVQQDDATGIVTPESLLIDQEDLVHGSKAQIGDSILLLLNQGGFTGEDIVKVLLQVA